MGPLGGLLGNKSRTVSDRESDKREEKEDKPSLIDRLYNKAGSWIDQQLTGEFPEDSFKTKIKMARVEYLKLSPYRRRHLAFFISLLLVFLLSSLFTASLVSGISVALFYAAFVALNQIKILNRLFNTLTDLIVAFTIFFLPESVKDLFSSLMKYIVYIILVITFGVYIGPAYMLYKGYLIASDNTEI